MCGSIVGTADQELKLGHKDKQLESLNSMCGLNLDLETFMLLILLRVLIGFLFFFFACSDWPL